METGVQTRVFPGATAHSKRQASASSTEGIHMSLTTKQPTGATSIRPFHAAIPDEALEDLHRRIASARWPSGELVADRSQGVQLATIRELARYWASEHDWRKCEARLNALPQFKTEIDGLDIHFIHARSSHENALPLIITHGWPGSVIELFGVVGPLTDPAAYGGRAEDAFDLVLPSLPGYGFSAEPKEVGWDPGRVARAWVELMRRLGYTRYVAQGGDQGAAVTDAMGRQAPNGLLGIHLNLLRGALGDVSSMPADREEERAALAAINAFRTSGFGYFLEQATRPQTIGYALLDSPVALAAWMLDHDTDSYYKISSAFVEGSASGGLYPGPHPRQRHAVLADGHRCFRSPVLLGRWTSNSCRRGGQAGFARRLAPRRLHHLPRRDLPRSAQLGPDVIPQSRLLQRGR